MRSFVRRLSLESKTEREFEVVAYAEITNFDGLKDAERVEKHEQYEAKLGNDRCRVRVTERQGQRTYDFTIKRKSENALNNSDCMEYTMAVDAEFLKAFKGSCDNMLVKTRYVYKTGRKTRLDVDGQTLEFDDIVYEVDVFESEQGVEKWCKIDIELNSVLEKLNEMGKPDSELHVKLSLKAIPLGLKGAFISRQETPEQSKMIQAFWDRVKRKVDRDG